MALYNGRNPANSAMPYLNKIPGATSPYLSPYFEAGTRALPTAEYQYNNLIGNPGGKINEIGQQFHESPGFQFALQRALQGAGHAAAAGGMAGSPQHEEENMRIGTQLGNQDYYNWLGPAVGMYERGLSGEQGLATGGQQAGTSIADMIAETLAQQGSLAFQGQRQKNQNQNDLISTLLKGGGAALSAFMPFSGFGSDMYGGS